MGICGNFADCSQNGPAGHRTLVITEGIFSMDGDAAPLLDIAELTERHGAHLFIDDAHGTGVMGQTGRGTLEHFGVASRIPFHMGTFSKAFGTSGAYVVGPSSLIQYLINRSRPFMYSTAPPPATAAATTAAIRLLRSEPQRLVRLWKNRTYFYDGLQAMGFRLSPTVSPIMPILIGDAQKATAFAERLLELNIYAPAVRPPTVPENQPHPSHSDCGTYPRTVGSSLLQPFNRLVMSKCLLA